MARSIKALIEPSLLIWARTTSGLSESEAAKRIGVSAGELEQWESGDEKPSISQLRKVSQVYKRHFSLFFLPKPPKEFEPRKVSLYPQTCYLRCGWLRNVVRSFTI